MARIKIAPKGIRSRRKKKNDEGIIYYIIIGFLCFSLILFCCIL